MEIDHARSHPPSDSTQSVLTVPPVIKMEHEHQHHQLEAAVAAGGKTGMHASEVAAMLLPHCAEEEAYAMPPLRLPEPLARNEPLDDAQV